MILLLDIGNTHTHVGLADTTRVLRHENLPTAGWRDGRLTRRLERFLGRVELEGLVYCSVVPCVRGAVRAWARERGVVRALELTVRTLRGLGVDYPRPATIGADRLANALAAWRRFGAPVLVVDFGTAVTFDVVDGKGNYVGGIIAPGLSAMTDYLHERTALLPRIRIRAVRRLVGRSTEEAMRIGAVHGYRGLVRELIVGLQRELGLKRLPVVATGGYAELMARGIPEIWRVDPLLTLEGLRLSWLSHRADGESVARSGTESRVDQKGKAGGRK
jgi:type III pantothenate kinase